MPANQKGPRCRRDDAGAVDDVRAEIRAEIAVKTAIPS
jgi:hypothetical protein